MEISEEYAKKLIKEKKYREAIEIIEEIKFDKSEKKYLLCRPNSIFRKSARKLKKQT